MKYWYSSRGSIISLFLFFKGQTSILLGRQRGGSNGEGEDVVDDDRGDGDDDGESNEGGEDGDHRRDGQAVGY